MLVVSAPFRIVTTTNTRIATLSRNGPAVRSGELWDNEAVDMAGRTECPAGSEFSAAAGIRTPFAGGARRMQANPPLRAANPASHSAAGRR